MLTIIRIITLPVVIPVKILLRLVRPSRIARRLLRKRNLLMAGAVVAAAAAQQRQKA
jgi:hypothetical protein